MMDASQDSDLYAKLLGETARLSWPEIERLFAAGRVIRVAAALDLLNVAAALSEDDTDRFREWMQSGQAGLLDDETATRWAAGDAELWGVVINPWVLVQERR